MSKLRFVKPEAVRLSLSDGDWVEIKRRLNFGEQKRIEGAMIKPVFDQTGHFEVGSDWENAEMVRLEQYLLDWSFRDESDKPVKLSPAAIRSLDPETADEIKAAIDAYLEEQEQAKKAMAGAPESATK